MSNATCLLNDARDFLFAHPYHSKASHMRECYAEAFRTYEYLKDNFTREAVQDFVAHASRLVRALEVVSDPDSKKSSLDTLKP